MSNSATAAFFSFFFFWVPPTSSFANVSQGGVRVGVHRRQDARAISLCGRRNNDPGGTLFDVRRESKSRARPRARARPTLAHSNHHHPHHHPRQNKQKRRRVGDRDPRAPSSRRPPRACPRPHLRVVFDKVSTGRFQFVPIWTMERLVQRATRPRESFELSKSRQVSSKVKDHSSRFNRIPHRYVSLDAAESQICLNSS